MLIREKIAIQEEDSAVLYWDIDIHFDDPLPASVALLVKASAKGDECAFTELYNLYKPVIRARARRYEPICPLNVDDLVQEIFLKLWEKRSLLNEIRDFHRYLSLMVRNRLTDQFRRRSCQRNFINANIAPDLLTTEHSHHAEIQQVYARVVSSLPLRARQAFELQRFMGLRRDQIADVMGLSIHSVRNHLARAQDMVKRQMASYLLN